MEEINNIDLNLYRIFLCVAECGSISKASELLYVSQPAVSYSIKTLESKLDCKLFNRTAKGVEMTAEANKLVYYIQSAYNILSTGIKMLNDSTELINGEIRIGVQTHVGTFLLSKYIEKFNEKYPGIKFSITNKSKNEMIEMLEKRMLDLVIDTYPITTTREEVVISELVKIQNYFVGNKKYKELSKRRNIPIEDLQKYPLLLPPMNTSTRQFLEKRIGNRIKKLDPLIEVPTTEVMLDLVIRGLGIGYFSKPSVEKLIREGVLNKINVDIDVPKNTICVAYIDEFLTSAPKRFLELIREGVSQEITRKEKSLRIILTQKCTHACSFCHKEGVRTKEENLLDAEDITFLYKAANEGLEIKRVSLTGGEPLLREDIIDILKRLRDNGAKISLTTNGYLLDQYLEIGEFLDEINISLHTLNKEKYIEICNNRVAHEKVISNIKLFRVKYPTINININMTYQKGINSQNEEIENMINFSKSIKTDLKIIELYPKNDKKYISINQLKPELIKLGYTKNQTTFRNIVYENNNHKVILEQCTCNIVSELTNGSLVCKENNDIFITPSGNISLCRNSNSKIKLLENIKNKDKLKIIQSLNEACNRMGECMQISEE